MQRLEEEPSQIANQFFHEVFDTLCDNDSQRLLLLDLLDQTTSPTCVLIVDDIRVRTSSPAACVAAIEALHTYATQFGVVLEAGPSGKAKVTTDGVQRSIVAELQVALAGTLQGDTPQCVDSCNFAGVPVQSRFPSASWRDRCETKAATIQDAVKLTNAVLLKASAVMKEACVRAAVEVWPMLARRFYLRDGFAACQYLAPLTITDKNAAGRIAFAQFRWAWAALTGMQILPKTKWIPVARRHQLLDDLGWKPLWHCAVAQALSMAEKMRWDDADFDHATAATRNNPAANGWFAAVQHIKENASIPDWQPDELALSDNKALQRSLARYRVDVIMPRLLIRQRGLQLPWLWIAANAGKNIQDTSL